MDEYNYAKSQNVYYKNILYIFIINVVYQNKIKFITIIQVNFDFINVTRAASLSPPYIMIVMTSDAIREYSLEREYFMINIIGVSAYYMVCQMLPIYMV